MTLKVDDPFSTDRLNSVSDFRPEWDVPALGQSFTDSFSTAVNAVRSNSGLDAQRKIHAFLGPAGYGKTHLFGRISHQQKEQVHFVFLQAVPGVEGAEQVLEGLAERHAVGLPHGAWRLSSLQFNTQAVDANTKMVLGDAVGGRVPWLSKGDHFTNELPEYFPPEWNGKLQAPSPQADVYALGVLACELLLGRAAVQRVRQQLGQSANAATPFREVMLGELKTIGLSRRGRQLLHRMLEPDPQRRPQHARAVLETPKHFFQPVSVLSLVCGVLVIVALGLAVGWSRNSTSLTVSMVAERLRP